jgi:hypothetical protein
MSALWEKIERLVDGIKKIADLAESVVKITSLFQ